MAVDQKPVAVAGFTLPPEVLSSIREASQRTGVDFKFLVAQAALESGFRSEAAAGRSSAAGLFQFTSQTWLGLMRQHGAQYGEGERAAKIERQSGGRYKVQDKATEREILALRSDPKLASMMAAEVTKANAQQLQRALGRKPNAAELRAERGQDRIGGKLAQAERALRLHLARERNRLRGRERIQEALQLLVPDVHRRSFLRPCAEGTVNPPGS